MDEHVQPETAIEPVHTELVQRPDFGALKTETDHGIGFEGVTVTERVKGLDGSIAEWG